jgi:RNA polymerase sigma-70 factor (ECF subfamily)
MGEGERRSVDEPEPSVVRAAAAGDVRAFEVLVRAYQAPVWRFLRRFLGDDALAEDVTQDTFVRVHRKLHTFDGRSKFSAWLFQIARNAGIDAVRGRDRRRRREAAQLPAPGPSPEAGHEIDAALAALSRDLREALLAVEVLGLSYVEAGALLGVPAGTVKSRVHRARERMLGWLAAGEEAAGG